MWSEQLLNLSHKTGYPIVQNNGQRVFGPPPNWRGPKPPKGCEIFVGKIPRDVFEQELVPIFQRIGPIYQFRLMMDYGGSNRGYGFVTYTSMADAQDALQRLQRFEIRRGRFLGVYASVDNCRLFIGGIPTNRTRSEVIEVLSELVVGIVDIIMYSAPSNPTRNRGYIFVEFENHRYAAMARRQLYYGTALWDAEIMVDWADPIPVVEPNIMSKVTKLYLRCLEPDLSTGELWMHLVSWVDPDEIRRVHKMLDYAFVHFTGRREAERAMKLLQGKSIYGKALEVEWARPKHYSKQHRMNTVPNNFCTSVPPRTRRLINLTKKSTTSTSSLLMSSSTTTTNSGSSTPPSTSGSSSAISEENPLCNELCVNCNPICAGIMGMMIV